MGTEIEDGDLGPEGEGGGGGLEGARGERRGENLVTGGGYTK